MVVDHGIFNRMEQMPISKFKATCLATLERVRRTGRPLRVTRFGKPIADIVPPAAPASTANWLGAMRGTAQIKGDIRVASSTLVRWQTPDLQVGRLSRGHVPGGRAAKRPE